MLDDPSVLWGSCGSHTSVAGKRANSAQEGPVPTLEPSGCYEAAVLNHSSSVMSQAYTCWWEKKSFKTTRYPSVFISPSAGREAFTRHANASVLAHDI